MEDHTQEAEKQAKSINHKSFLIYLKYIIHLITFCYILYTLFGFLGIDLIAISYFAHLSILPWISLYLCSKKFKYCYVHRLPLYYIAINEILTVADNYIGIPLSVFNLLVLHLILIGILIISYSVYYVQTRNLVFKTNSK